MAKRTTVRIVRRRIVRVSDELMNIWGDPQKVKAWCAWCHAPKVCSKKPCEICGYHATALLPHSNRSRMFVELF